MTPNDTLINEKKGLETIQAIMKDEVTDQKKSSSLRQAIRKDAEIALVLCLLFSDTGKNIAFDHVGACNLLLLDIILFRNALKDLDKTISQKMLNQMFSFLIHQKPMNFINIQLLDHLGAKSVLSEVNSVASKMLLDKPKSGKDFTRLCVLQSCGAILSEDEIKKALSNDLTEEEQSAINRLRKPMAW